MCNRKIVRHCVRGYEFSNLEFRYHSHAMAQVWPINLNGNQDDDDDDDVVGERNANLIYLFSNESCC